MHDYEEQMKRATINFESVKIAIRQDKNGYILRIKQMERRQLLKLDCYAEREAFNYSWLINTTKQSGNLKVLM
jgi:hypothetical protein